MYDQVRPDWAWDDPDAELLRRMYRANVRAALIAIRDPGVDVEGDAVQSWQGVIDAILREP